MNLSMKNLRRSVRESSLAGRAYICAQRLSQAGLRTKRSVIFFPGEMYTGTPGDLRACAIAIELRKFGWRTLIVPNWLSLKARRSIIRSQPGAILFFQQSRHPLNVPRLYPGNLSAFDADDADILNDPERVIACLQSADTVIAGSQFLAEAFRPYNSSVRVVWTGSYVKSSQNPRQRASPPVIVWAQSNPFDYPHEADLVMNLWKSLAAANLHFSVAIYSNEPVRAQLWLQPLTSLGIGISIRPRMRYRAFVDSLSGDTIGLQPICPSFAYSKGKSFGKVLAYLAAGIPVIASDDVDHRLFFRHQENGVLVQTAEDWVAAATQLLTNEAEQIRLAKCAHADFLSTLTTQQAAQSVNAALEQLLERKALESADRLEGVAAPTLRQ